MTRVFVGNLGEGANRRELEKEFEYYGPLKDVWVARNPPGFAFIVFEDSRDAQDAIKKLDSSYICGKRVRVELASNDARRGGYRGGRRGGRGGFGGGGRCYECGREGHFARDCRDRRSGGGDRGGGGGGGYRRYSRSRSRSPPPHRRMRSRSRSRTPPPRQRDLNRSRSSRSRSP